jgi:hypothetical protein
MSKGIQLADALLCVGPGWGSILTRLYAQLPQKVIVTQVKEKYGSLRFYVGSASELVFRKIQKAEKESETTCEVCGKPGTIITEGWWKCRCPECDAKERSK